MSMYNMKATGCTTAFRFWLFGLTSSWFLQEHKGFQNSGLKRQNNFQTWDDVQRLGSFGLSLQRQLFGIWLICASYKPSKISLQRKSFPLWPVAPDPNKTCALQTCRCRNLQLPAENNGSAVWFAFLNGSSFTSAGVLQAAGCLRTGGQAQLKTVQLCSKGACVHCICVQF